VNATLVSTARRGNLQDFVGRVSAAQIAEVDVALKLLLFGELP
jgi:mRNA-degrading endonuclease toxin of MazEF toxin-antitoxin module